MVVVRVTSCRDVLDYVHKFCLSEEGGKKFIAQFCRYIAGKLWATENLMQFGGQHWSRKYTT